MPDTAGKREPATRTCLILLGVLFVLNVLDTAVTLVVITPENVMEAEANLVPRLLLNADPLVFACVKLGAVTAALAWAWWRLRKGSSNLHIIKPVLYIITVAMAIVVAIGASALAA